MKDKGIIIIIIVMIFGFLVFQQYWAWKKPPPSVDEQLLEKINNLELKIDSLSHKKDSIKTIIVQIERTIDKNHKNYEKVVNTILDSNDSTNYVWAKRYIEEYRLKHSK